MEQVKFLSKILKWISVGTESQPDVKRTAKDLKKELANDIYACLKSYGFKKKGMNFSLPQNDLVYFIQIQSSLSSTSTACLLTLNIGIVSLKLCTLTEIERPSYYDSHWMERIGFFMDKPADKWWTLKDQVSTSHASDEIIELLANRVLPDIFSFKTTSDLEGFWLKGHSTGLTERQRQDYLKLLGH